MLGLLVARFGIWGLRPAPGQRGEAEGGEAAGGELRVPVPEVSKPPRSSPSLPGASSLRSSECVGGDGGERRAGPRESSGVFRGLPGWIGGKDALRAQLCPPDLSLGFNSSALLSHAVCVVSCKKKKDLFYIIKQGEKRL